MRKTILLSLLSSVLALTSCVNNGGQTFGVLPEGVELNSGDKLDVKSATYDDLLHELRITWKGTPANNFKGIKASYTTLSGVNKTITIKADPNFPTSYQFFTVATKLPNAVTFQYIWNNDGHDTFSEEINTANLKVRNESATSRFMTMKAPAYTYEPIPNLDANHDKVVQGYNDLAGETDEQKGVFFTNLLKTVLSAAYFTAADVDGGRRTPDQPVKTLRCKVSDMSSMGGVYAYVINYSDADGGPEFDLAYNILSAQASGSGIDVPGWEGVTKHEFTHLIQTIPGSAASETDRMSMQEGYADAIRTATGGFTDEERINNGVYAASQPYFDANRKDGDLPIPYIWQSKYQISGNFMAWLRCYDGDFLRKLSLSASKIDQGWTLETAVKYILGKDFDIKKLWEEYCNDVKAEAGK